MDTLIKASYISLNCTASSQAGVFDKIANIADENGLLTNIEQTVDALQAREDQSTTGFMDGFAIPHAKTDAVTKPAIIVVRTETTVEWNSLDGQPAFFFLSLLIPESEAGTTHLHALSALSRTLMDVDIRQAMLDAQSGEQLANILKQSITDGEGA